MDGGALLVALGTTIALLLSLGAAGISMAAWLRPQRDVERLRAKVNDLSSLRLEWENAQQALDSLNKRAARLQRIEQRAVVDAEAHELPAQQPGRRRTLSIADVQGGRQ